MAAGIVASSVLAFQDLELESLGSIWLLLMTILLAFVMVSNFRYRSFKDLDLKERLPFRLPDFGRCDSCGRSLASGSHALCSVHELCLLGCGFWRFQIR